MSVDQSRVVAGTATAWLLGFGWVLLLGSTVAAAVVAVLASAAVVVLFGPGDLAGRLTHGTAVGLVVVVAGVLVPVAVRGLERFDAGTRLVASTVAAVVVLLVGIAVLRAFVFDAADGVDG